MNSLVDIHSRFLTRKVTPDYYLFVSGATVYRYSLSNGDIISMNDGCYNLYGYLNGIFYCKTFPNFVVYTYNITSFQRIASSTFVSLVKKSSTENALIALAYQNSRYTVLKSTDGYNFQAVINNTIISSPNGFEFFNQVFYTWSYDMLYYFNGVLEFLRSYSPSRTHFPFPFHHLLLSILMKHIYLMESSTFQ